MIKVVAQFDHLRGLPHRECERHYLEVHVPFIRHAVRHAENIVTYETNLVVAQRDVDGGWHARPTAWRWATGRFQGSSDDPPAPLPPPFARLVSEDHRNFLKDLRMFTAEEQVRVDRRSGQTSLAKFSLHVDRRATTPAVEAQRRLEQGVSPMIDAAQHAFGARLVVCDRVFRQAQSAAIDEEGQVMSPELLCSQTMRVSHIDFYFDTVEWGEEFFAAHREELEAVLHDPAFERARLYQVQERSQVDKR